jgi:hypothetical protein
MSAKSIMDGIAKARRQMYEGIRDGMLTEGQAIMKRSNDEFAPRDEGDLIAESGVTLEEDGENIESLKVTLHYGGEKTNSYAIPTHETPSGFDPPTWKGKEIRFTTGGAKYLERPLLEAENGMIERIASKVKLS